MADWYAFAILALFLMGLQRFLYKVSAERKCNTAWTTFSFMATVALLSSILFTARQETVADVPFLVFIALLNSGSFLIGTMAHIEALKHVPAAIAYSITRLNIVLVVIFSVVFLNDQPSPCQMIGIACAVAVIVVLTRQPGDHGSSYGEIKQGLIYVTISVICGAVAGISSKYAAVHTDILAFMALSYAIGAVVSLGLRGRFETVGAKGKTKDAFIIGIVMGLINFAGFYAFLKALTSGPLSIVASITGMHFVIAVVLSVFIYREKLTPFRAVGVLLTIVSIILLRL
jgi:uncharacterized membrane protein